jgi:phosphoglycolate phosphatase-like HAD superfamily hydrolase
VIKELWGIKMDKLFLDFDGTLTNVDIEAQNFIPGFLEGVRKTLDIKTGEFMNEWIRLREHILSNPQIYGWSFNGKIIAPAYSDPYVLSTTIAQEMIKKYNYPDDKFLFSLFKENYAKTGTAFRPGAKDFLNALKEKYDMYIITNSSTDSVQKKLDTLGVDIPIIGNAKKYELDNSLENVPESVDKDFGRPIYLRRKKYYDILKSFGNVSGVPVIGDIYELDLALPQHLGMDPVLIYGQQTWSKEQNAVEKKADTLEGLLKYLI